MSVTAGRNTHASIVKLTSTTKNNDARYTANNTLPAHHQHKACTKHKRKHFHEII